MALGGVLITNGIPREAAIAIKTAVEGAGSMLAARGISMVTAAVLLINAEIRALAKQRMNSLRTGDTSCQGIPAPATLTIPDCSRRFPRAIPPAISMRVDQSIRPRSSRFRRPEPNRTAVEVKATIADDVPWKGSD